jgi:diguanylate cyclase (GGDEF)-like protein
MEFIKPELENGESPEKKLAGELLKAQKEIENLRIENEKLKELAFIDSLTGLSSRIYFENEVEKYLKDLDDQRNEKGQRKNHLGFKDLSLIYCDLDNFKSINDTFGHDVGDEVLVQVARIMKSVVRNYDIVCRRGGDEFVIAFPGATKEIAAQRAEQIQQLFHKAVEEDKNKYAGLETSLSMGVATYSVGVTLPELLKEADELMYEAKQKGKGQVAV